ncbi:MAG: hypothetical protein GQ532_15605 [Methylomarinum sp.]|nr:hypothetical protein [Methylomarinum sp.]
MNNNIIKGLSGLCLLLILALIIEWWLIEAPEQVSEQAIIGDDAQVELPKLTLAKKTVESYTQMVESPLFIKGRKPVIDGEENGLVNEDIGQIDDLVLLGIYSNKDKLNALFNKKGKQKTYLKKSEGEDVAGWLIKEIKADSVVLELAGKQKTVMLRKPKPTTIKKPKRTPRNNTKLKS